MSKLKLTIAIVTLIMLVTMIISCAGSTTPPGTASTPTLEETDIAERYAFIKGMDSSQMILYDWSFLYRWADYSQPPPKGFMYSADTERRSEVLYLKSSSDGTKTPVNLNEIASMEWSWELDKEATRISGSKWFNMKSITIIKNNGERVLLADSIHEYIYMSELTSKEYALKGSAYLYLVGNMRNKEAPEDTVKFPLFYPSSINYENDNFLVPEEIIFSNE